MDQDLTLLRWHWGSAYSVCHPEPGVWLAVRCDDHTTLRAETPLELLQLVRQDYQGRPVPRAKSAP